MIEVNHLSKQYGQFKAVDNVSFEVKEGEILGFLGPNGAGKSTTMNIITGYISATEGTIKIDGFDILKEPEQAKKRIGYLPEIPPLYIDMTVNEYLEFVAELKKVEKEKRKQMIEEIKESVKITDVEQKLIKTLSKGYKQRVGLAQAMIGYPDVLILDEPTVGLDPKQMIEFRDMIQSLGKKHTIILSSHILSEVSAVCDRVLIISKGKIVASDTPEKLSDNLSKGHRLKVRLKGETEKITKALKNEQKIIKIEEDGEKEKGTLDFVLEAQEREDIREIVFRLAVENGLIVLMMKSMDMSLEDIFLQVTSQENAIALTDEIQTQETEEESNHDSDI